MSSEHRRSPRKSKYASAFLYTGTGSPLGKCIVKDISNSGAKLVYQAVDELPTDLLVTFGRERRACRLIWRRDHEIGVRFGTA